MLIVGGYFEVDPSERDAFIAGRLDSIRASRSEPGCLEYAMAPDPLEAHRVLLMERWESQDALDAHLVAQREAPRPAGPQVAPTAVSITIYDVAGERPLA